MTADAEKSVPKHVAGLDQIRFVLALVVVFGHCGYFPFLEPRGTSMVARVSRAVFHNIVSGPAAVIGFFLISGFCIHFPYRHVRSVRLLPFFARRHIRILVPAICAVLLARATSVDLSNLDHSILWSLVCEEIYYTLYPMILPLSARIGMSRLVIVSFVVAYLVIVASPRLSGNYPDLGWRLTWVVGYPCWLLGAQLAESFDSLSKVDSGLPVWCARLAVWIGATLTSVLRFHSPLHYRWTLDLFAVGCYFWLRREIRHAKRGRTGVLERAGSFSYSLYLVHVQAASLWTMTVDPRAQPWLWPLKMLFIVGAAAVFFLAVERPAHRIAREVQRWLSRVRPNEAAVSAQK